MRAHRTVHGGMVFALADTAFAYVCNGKNEKAVAAQASIVFLGSAQDGETLIAEAEELATSLARFPQACLRSDRASMLEQEGLGEEEALAAELRHGAAVLAESLEGAARFASGAGRHGSFDEA